MRTYPKTQTTDLLYKRVIIFIVYLSTESTNRLTQIFFCQYGKFQKHSFFHLRICSAKSYKTSKVLKSDTHQLLKKSCVCFFRNLPLYLLINFMLLVSVPLVNIRKAEAFRRNRNKPVA